MYIFVSNGKIINNKFTDKEASFFLKKIIKNSNKFHLPRAVTPCFMCLLSLFPRESQ